MAQRKGSKGGPGASGAPFTPRAQGSAYSYTLGPFILNLAKFLYLASQAPRVEQGRPRGLSAGSGRGHYGMGPGYGV